MFKIQISLSFIDIINKSWHLLHTYVWNLNHLFKKYQCWQISQSFDSFVLLVLNPSETSFYHSIAFIFYSKTCFLGNSCEAFSKNIL